MKNLPIRRRVLEQVSTQSGYLYSNLPIRRQMIDQVGTQSHMILHFNMLHTET